MNHRTQVVMTMAAMSVMVMCMAHAALDLEGQTDRRNQNG